jgi:signal transduction histidine kinase
MRGRWERLGLRGRLALSFGAIVIVAFAIVFVAVRAQMSHEQTVIGQEEEREAHEPGATRDRHDNSESPIEDAQSDVEQTFLVVGAAALVAALLAGYLVAARTAAPLRRFAGTAADVDAGDLSPRVAVDPSAAAELRTLADSFNHMLDRLEDAFARQRGFVSDASHELRSPLTAIRGQIEVLAREPDPGAADVRRVEATTLAELRRVERLRAPARSDASSTPTPSCARPSPPPPAPPASAPS